MSDRAIRLKECVTCGQTLDHRRYICVDCYKAICMSCADSQYDDLIPVFDLTFTDGTVERHYGRRFLKNDILCDKCSILRAALSYSRAPKIK